MARFAEGSTALWRKGATPDSLATFAALSGLAILATFVGLAGLAGLAVLAILAGFATLAYSGGGSDADTRECVDRVS